MDSSNTHFLQSLLVFSNSANQGIARLKILFLIFPNCKPFCFQQSLLSLYITQIWAINFFALFWFFSFFDIFFTQLIRSLHKYRLDNGKGTEIERLFVFSKNGPYMEMAAVPLLKKSLKFRISEVYEGFVHGLWVCIFAFHAGHRPSTTCFPSILSISRWPNFPKVFLNLPLLGSHGLNISYLNFEIPICYYHDFSHLLLSWFFHTFQDNGDAWLVIHLLSILERGKICRFQWIVYTCSFWWFW